MKSQRREPRLQEYHFAAMVVLDLSYLPVRLHRHSLPNLLRRMDAQTAGQVLRPTLTPQRAAEIVRRIATMRIFRMSVFPRPCLRRALVLFKHLRRMGYPASFVIGVLTHGDNLRAHSWVTVNTRMVGEPDSTSRYRPVYTYPATESDQLIEPEREWIRDLSHSKADGYDVG